MKKYFCLLVVLLLQACAEVEIPTSYKLAMEQLKSGEYYLAAQTFEAVEENDPFTQEAINAQIMAAYAYYKSGTQEDSLRVIEYFIQNNPIDRNLSYMYYLKGLNYYEDIKSIQRSRDIAEKAQEAFQILAHRFPKTPYRVDAELRIVAIKTYLSGNELIMANYYLSRKNYIGVLNHLSEVLRKYPNSKYTAEVLYRMVEVNDILQIKKDVLRYNSLLENNYRNTEWAKAANKIAKKYDKV